MPAFGGLLCVLVLAACAVGQVTGQHNTPPLFSSPLGVVNVQEEADSGYVVYQVQATDIDGDPITYYSDPSSATLSLFGVNNQTGEIFILDSGTRLDRDLLTPLPTQYLTFRVYATDGNVHELSDQVFTLYIYLLDINDNHPIITNLPSTVVLAENTPLGSVLFTVTATDADSGANGLIFFELELNSSVVSVERQTGEVLLMSSLDFDVPTNRDHAISIRAEDLGNVSLSDVETLRISVTDVNDLDPFFDPPSYYQTVYENTTQGELVAEVTAYDGDRGVDDAVEYWLEEGNSAIEGNGSFYINRTTGQIFVNVTDLDRETHSTYTLTVKATEVSDPSKEATATVTIVILDVNDNVPMFERSEYTANVSEGLDPGDHILQVTASDRDHGVNADFEFELRNLENDTDFLPFSISSVGGEGYISLSNNGSLDFEDKESYLFWAIAREVVGGVSRYGTTIVRVYVENENDVNPMFERSEYNVTISEGADLNSFVEEVVALDGDKGSFGEVFYTLISGHFDQFNITTTSLGGVVRTADALDYEMRSSYVITVQATDSAEQGSQPRTAAATLSVEVVNLNDNPPEFQEDRLEVELEEEREPGTVVARLEVSDADGDELTERTFSILSGDDFGNFTFDYNNSNVLVTVVPLDYDLNPDLRRRELVIEVNDTVWTDTITMVISLLDINDNSPHFENDSYQFYIDEEVPIGTEVGVVVATDADSGDFGRIFYSISDNQKFAVNGTTGQVYTVGQLDTETESSYTVQLIASDLDPDLPQRRTMSVQANIFVRDINDNAPEFTESQYQFQVRENTATISLPVPATDSDTGDNGRLTFSISSGNLNNAFTIDGETGEVMRNASQPLDRELQESYSLVVTATDGGSIPLNTSVNVSITVLDENDEDPTFQQQSYNTSISEDTPPGSIALQVTASDADTGSNSRLTYTIISVTSPPQPDPGQPDPAPSPPSGTFTIDQTTGIIRTQGTFDREAFEGPYVIQVRASDGGSVSRSGSAEVTISLEDVNDNDPVFSPQSYTAVITEELVVGVSVVTVTANDSDTGSNSVLRYDITSVVALTNIDDQTQVSTHFSINSTSGQLSTNSSLDYEFVQRYRITVIATDSGDNQRSSSATVTVNVVDTNDNSPLFSEDSYSLNISEATLINSRFSLVQVSDLDSNLNGRIIFTSDVTSPFRVDRETGELVVIETLDFETNSSYYFTINASDSGSEPLSNTVPVTVTILNVNDNGPQFTNSSYSASIPEGDYISGQLLTTVTAIDADAGMYGEVSYQLLSGDTSLFSLDSQNGEVWAVAERDFESLSSSPDQTQVDRQLVIQARDTGSPARTASTTVTIVITDLNDNAPMFSSSQYSTSVRENSSPGQELQIAVRATDLDGNRNGDIRYSLQGARNFSIDEVTGVITTGSPNDVMRGTPLFDFESQPSYTFTVVATDNGTVPQVAEATVNVLILDANDNPPVIIGLVPPSFSLLESHSQSSVLSTVHVFDFDVGDNAEFDYQLSNDGGLFSIDEEGQVRLAGQLDRETVDYYSITITVTDRGQPRMSAEDYLYVEVLDFNDNPPSFAQDTYTALLWENASLVSTVTTLRVQDRDTGDNGLLRFSIAGDEAHRLAFRVDSRQLDSGWWEVDIITALTFDYETGIRFFELEIQAVDSASPFHTNAANLTITILDVNDNAPDFSLDTYSIQVSENLPVGGVAGSVLATDPDGANNGIVSYRFANGTATSISSTFSLGPDTGVLTLLSSLDFETSDSYSFSVLASDGGSPTRISTASVSVTVLDVNEAEPVFVEGEYSTNIQENRDSGEFVIQVEATDPESGASVEYQIVTGSEQALTDFVLDSGSGVLTTAVALDRERVAAYQMTIQARDSGGANSRTGYTQVSVQVTDVNDNDPVFPSDSHTYLLSEGSQSGTALTPSLLASDPDQGTNGEILYSLTFSLSQHDSLPFSVDSDSGLITLSSGQELDRETTPSYSFSLVATDQGPERRTGSVQITVTLIDVNDHPPMFEEDSYSVSVTENSPPGVLVVQVTAIDDDAMDILVYNIVSGDPEGQFSIDSSSGLIMTGTTSLDRETQDIYYLTVTVTDSIMRTVSAEVVVEVADLNDNAPFFSSPTFSSSHPENNSNSLVVHTVTAEDPDAGSNGDVRYSITGGNSGGVFSIDTVSGEVLANAGRLDYETQSVHTLTIQATDLATPVSLRQTSTAVLTVEVEDRNDNRPTFSQSEYHASIPEDADVGTTVIVISASDGDSGSNGDVVFSFQTSTSIFSIDGDTGVVTLNGELNFELVPSYELTVQARDNGSPERRHVASLQIDIINRNDENPRFTISFYTASIDEGSATMTSVLTVSASDPDNTEGDLLTYSILPSSNQGGYFQIGVQTGVIYVARIPDREILSSVDLVVVASDEDDNNGTATVQITIRDINDNAPEFTSDSYSVSLRENSAVGTTLVPFFGGNSTRVEAVDIDGPGLNSEVSYDKTGEDQDKFTVDKDTGIVTVAPGAVLDREVDDVLSLVITAEDHGVPENTGSVTMTISLLDVNDNAPTFVPQFGYAVRVAENGPFGTVLLTAVASDPDLGGGGVVRFGLSSASPLNKLNSFFINSTSGDIILTESLDREEDPLIILTISAQDTGVPTMVTSTTVQITVTDVNDNSPQFSQDTYITSVSEQISVGAAVLTVSADDPDIGLNGQVTYMVAGNNGLFTVNPVTGEVTTIGPLDYETQQTHSVTVQACDQGSERECSQTEVIVYVTDFNDEPPIFDVSTFRTDICSNLASGQVFIHPAASDRDFGSNSQLIYSISDSVSGLLGVHSDSGKMFLNRAVTEEEVGSEVSTLLTARDGGNPSLFGVAEVVVRIVNCTTGTFRFMQTFYEFETEEFNSLLQNNGGAETFEEIKTVPAEVPINFDPQFLAGEFRIGHNLIILNERRVLDREVRDIYVLPVWAEFEGQRAYTTVVVRVRDLNDNRPQFQLSAFSFSVSENETTPLEVTRVTATDRDDGTNAEVSFSFVTADPYFSIDNVTGLITTATILDREDITQHTLTIVVTDGGSLTDTQEIRVEVTDVNDNQPRFSQPLFSVSLVENSPAGSSVLTLSARDEDTGSNGDISYSIVGGDLAIFELHSMSGAIHTRQPLDFETRTHYLLQVQAQDNGAPILSSETAVNITVLDFNDNSPIFLSPVARVLVSESAPRGSVLADFNATDRDSGLLGTAGISFSIAAGDGSLFSVNSVSGILRTTSLLDLDSGPECHFLTIRATDSAPDNSLSNTTEIEVCLIDVNDNCPNFTQPSFRLRVREDEDVNEELMLTLQATDRDYDTATNGAVVYSLLEDRGVFDISATSGALSLSSSLDKETTSSYELVAQACDLAEEPCCTNTTIYVEVLDINDNPPLILNVPSSDTCLPVLETGSCQDRVQDVGDVVFTVNATDPDTGLSGSILFQPLQDTTQPFQLSVSGVIIISSSLDFEREQSYLLYISARDQGTPIPRTSETAILCVNLLDLNDNPPVFSAESYSVFPEEGPRSSPSLLTRLLATDLDQTAPQNAITGFANAEIKFSISEGNTSLFSIDEDTGDLFVLYDLDCEERGSYVLTVVANNSLSACPLYSETSVFINVTDINDNAPIFHLPLYEATIFENISVSTAVLTVSASDSDKISPNNDTLFRLELGGGSNPFHLDQNTGVLSVQNPLDSETHPQPYNLTVVVEDKGVPIMSSSAVVIVTVIDVNDEPPLFERDRYDDVSVSEGESSFPLPLLFLNTTDRDRLAENRENQYSLLSTSALFLNGSSLSLETDVFSIDSDGQLYLFQSVDRETVTSYEITVFVRNRKACARTDGGGCWDTAEVVVTVTDVNDNPPCFPQSEYGGEVSVTAERGTQILTVQASDPDTKDDFGVIRYRLETTAEGRFRIDEQTGAIITRGDFTNLDGETLTLQVVAYDNLGGEGSLTCGTVVRLVVLNDFQRISIDFNCGYDDIVAVENDIISVLKNVSGLDIQVESYFDFSSDSSTNFIFHAVDTDTNEIVDFTEFFRRLERGVASQGSEVTAVGAEEELIDRLSTLCPVERITAFANIAEYSYPDAVETQSVVILVLCLILFSGAVATLILSVRQRWVALHDTRSKLLADVFYGSPGSTSLVENVRHDTDFPMEQIKTGGGGNRQNPMFVQPYDNWQEVDASAPESTGDISSMNRDNPLYESQEIRMEMFADVSDEEEGDDEADDAQLLAAALKDEEEGEPQEPEDNSVTAI